MDTELRTIWKLEFTNLQQSFNWLLVIDDSRLSKYKSYLSWKLDNVQHLKSWLVKENKFKLFVFDYFYLNISATQAFYTSLIETKHRRLQNRFENPELAQHLKQIQHLIIQWKIEPNLNLELFHNKVKGVQRTHKLLMTMLINVHETETKLQKLSAHLQLSFLMMAASQTLSDDAYSAPQTPPQTVIDDFNLEI